MIESCQHSKRIERPDGFIQIIVLEDFLICHTLAQDFEFVLRNLIEPFRKSFIQPVIVIELSLSVFNEVRELEKDFTQIDVIILLLFTCCSILDPQEVRNHLLDAAGIVHRFSFDGIQV